MKKRLLAMVMVACLSFGVIGCSAKEKERVLFPSEGTAALVPEPENCENGKVTFNSDGYFCADFTDYSMDEYKSYVKAVKEAGFTKDFTEYDDAYFADNENGDTVQITYHEDDSEMSVDVYENKSETVSSLETETK